MWRTAASAGDAKNTGYLRGPQNSSFTVVRSLQMESGNINSFANVYKLWKGTVYYDSQHTCDENAGAFYADGEKWTDYAMSAISTSIVLNKINDSEYFDEHILNWKALDFVNPTEPTWSHWLGGLKTISQQDTIKSKVTKKGTWGVHETGNYVDTSINKQYWQYNINNDNRTYKYQNFGDWFSGEYNSYVTYPLKGVGIIEKTFNSNNIYQWEKSNDSYQYSLQRNANLIANGMTLCNGYLVGYVKKDETFEWEPVISGKYFPYNKTTYFNTHDYTKNDVTYHQYGDYCLDGLCTNAAHNVTNVPKWRVVLATCYFGEGTNYWTNLTLDGANDGKIIKEDGQTTDHKTLTNGSSVKFKFKADKDCYVVAKWYPEGMKNKDTNADLGEDDCYWYGTLDLTKCGTYKITADN